MKRRFQKLIAAVMFSLHSFKQMEVRVILGFLSGMPGEAICDVGCGFGHFSIKLAKIGAKVTGIDINERAVENARELGRRYDCRFICGSAERLPFDTAAFDKVVSVCVLEHLDNDEATLQEIHRVLKPGGTLVLSVDTLDYPGVGESFRNFHRKSARVVNYYTYPELARRLQALGFSLDDKRYIINSPVSSFFFKLGKKMAWGPVYMIMFPVVFTLSLVSDYLFGHDDSGYQLVIKASKPESAKQP